MSHVNILGILFNLHSAGVCQCKNYKKLIQSGTTTNYILIQNYKITSFQISKQDGWVAPEIFDGFESHNYLVIH